MQDRSISKALAAALALPLLAPATLAGGGGDLDWFDGTWEQALAKAKAEDKVVFADFWADWCHWCKELDKRTFTDEAVQELLDGMVLVSVDVETEVGGELSQRYSNGSMPLPTLLFVGPDGEPREALQGFLPAPDFLSEARRIQRDVDTIGDLRRRIRAEPDDLATRWTLSEKLSVIGDAAGAEGQIAAIAERDPERRSLPLQRLDLEEVVEGVGVTMDVAPLHAFLAQTEHDEIRFRAWYVIGQVEEHLAERADTRSDAEAHREHWDLARSARRSAWAHVPREFVPFAGRAIASAALSNAEHCSEDDFAFALETAKAAALAEPEDGEAADLVARLLFTLDRTEEALAIARAWAERHPDDRRWKARVEEFGG